MKQKTWPSGSGNHRFTALLLDRRESHPRYESEYPPSRSEPAYTSKRKSTRSSDQHRPSSRSSSSRTHRYDYSALPYDVVSKIAASFKYTDLRAASLACKAWRDALAPLREAMLFLRWGKRYKHGRGGVKPNLSKALDSFLKGAARGSTLAMVDAGLLYWDMGDKEKGIALYRKAAELGDPAGQCNLGLSYLQADPPFYNEALKWLYKASLSGHVRAQYQLALCLHQGRGLPKNLREAARWYQQAAVGGYARAMYNTSLCYSGGVGFSQSHQLARKWMQRAANCGHVRAQFEHGLGLFAEGDMMKAVVYLELAGRAGEIAADRVKAVVLQKMSLASREQAMRNADNWRPLPSSR
ncbi:OLC1v1028383C2 [Oldenlandia corymbosa var. corymbosa]|uniref:OLC1v1028383C2 n=1 Tax=Oldenlandia corymbosa var. corymbosa TaxID=529605 RepID=A0AAV1CBJ7_OLDCO|nr:OLC1v1028383C2 [Oldenlandia corymbosa var. corymbosa]